MTPYSARPTIKRRQPLQGGVVNIKFLSPTVLLFITTVIFLISLPMLPVQVRFPLKNGAVVFWLICFLSFLGGTTFTTGSRVNMQVRNYQPNPKTVKKFMLLLVGIGFVGTVLLLIDRYWIRGVSLAVDALENREILSNTKASPISAIAAIASSLGILSYVTIWVAELNQVTISRWIKLVSVLNVLVAVLVNIQLGSRSLLLIVLMIHLFAWFFIFRVRGGKVKLRHLLSVVSILLSMAIGSAALMAWRTELMGMSMLDSISISTYAYTITPSQSMLNGLLNGDSLAVFSAALFSLVQYVFHGIYEFSLLFTDFHGAHEMGNQTLWLPIKMASMLTGGWFSVGVFDNSGVREGVFSTFVGPIFIDFGLISPFILFLYGALVAIPFRLLRRGRVEWLPAVALVATSMLLWPIVNIFASASGTYLLTGAIAIGWLGKRLRGNQVVDGGRR